jgi:hypothetical protein
MVFRQAGISLDQGFDGVADSPQAYHLQEMLLQLIQLLLEPVSIFLLFTAERRERRRSINYLKSFFRFFSELETRNPELETVTYPNLPLM